eukprot:768459-Hanusia_phi.AAC.14
MITSIVCNSPDNCAGLPGAIFDIASPPRTEFRVTPMPQTSPSFTGRFSIGLPLRRCTFLAMPFLLNVSVTPVPSSPRKSAFASLTSPLIRDPSTLTTTSPIATWQQRWHGPPCARPFTTTSPTSFCPSAHPTPTSPTLTGVEPPDRKLIPPADGTNLAKEKSEGRASIT